MHMGGGCNSYSSTRLKHNDEIKIAVPFYTSISYQCGITKLMREGEKSGEKITKWSWTINRNYLVPYCSTVCIKALSKIQYYWVLYFALLIQLPYVLCFVQYILLTTLLLKVLHFVLLLKVLHFVLLLKVLHFVPLSITNNNLYRYYCTGSIIVLVLVSTGRKKNQWGHWFEREREQK